MINFSKYFFKISQYIIFTVIVSLLTNQYLRTYNVFLWKYFSNSYKKLFFYNKIVFFNGGLITNWNTSYFFFLKNPINSLWTPYFRKDGYFGFFIDNAVWR